MEPLALIALGIFVLVTEGCSEDTEFGIKDPEPKDLGIIPANPPVILDSYSDDYLDVVEQEDSISDYSNNLEDFQPESVGEDLLQPVDPAGHNSNFLFGADCFLSDIDVFEGDKGQFLFGTCQKPVKGEQYTRYFSAVANFPMEKSTAALSSGVGNTVLMPVDGSATAFQVAVAGLHVGGDGPFFNSVTQVFSGVNHCVGGIAVMEGNRKHVSTFGPVSSTGLGLFPEGEYFPCDTSSALFSEGEDGNEMWFPAVLPTEFGDVGVVVGCSTLYDLPFDITKDSCEGEPIIVGPRPSAIAEIGDVMGTGGVRFAAVVNAKGSEDYSIDYITSNASIDLVTLDRFLQGTSGLLQTIDLGVKEVFESAELPLTEDGKTAIALAEGLFIVADLESASVTAAFADPELALESSGAQTYVSGVAVRDGIAYVAMKSLVGSGMVFAYDISDPLSPHRIANYEVDGLSGAIAVDARGIVFAATQKTDDQTGEFSYGVTAIDPALVI